MINHYQIRHPKECRGRNGWFRARTIQFWRAEHPDPDYGPRVCLDIFGSRRGNTAPVVVYLSPEDAVEIGKLLQTHGELMLARGLAIQEASQ